MQIPRVNWELEIFHTSCPGAIFIQQFYCPVKDLKNIEPNNNIEHFSSSDKAARLLTFSSSSVILLRIKVKWATFTGLEKYEIGI